MKRSTKRIMTTHAGSLARPKDLLEMMDAKLRGKPYDQEAYANRIRGAVAEMVRQQVECGVDIVTDGEQSKPSFNAYLVERLTGIEPVASSEERIAARMKTDEARAFPEYYEKYFAEHMCGVGPNLPVACTGPITYKGQQAVQTDIENLRAAFNGLSPEEVFMPAIAPGFFSNQYYRTEEEFQYALAEALRVEYLAIVDAGFILQIDDPSLTRLYRTEPSLTVAERVRDAEIYIEALNHALRGIPEAKIRYHTCYGINEGPRVFDIPLKDIIGLMLKVNAEAISFEAANPRHEHEWRLWENIKLPAGKILIPGVITHCSNIVEHPELVAERIIRYAKLVGRENVIGGSDCGFSSQATFTPEIHPTVVWAKFKAMAEGAKIATKQLWS
ncbi:MAG: cobalamin-independent methionine synthase II family protein [Deltaproteobacteria bacterium]|nr:cobalamin-independent methionine synthase II family protein [Deltaproteobacteria bacterium]MBI2365836.1 cobalamin-independent methionine synthase II family protein [Deltaproteobacteria bacterium]MBI2533901.1 cobalamin-independent methionine synthase II family protein [Deltaproteobacteria bacterium]